MSLTDEQERIVIAPIDAHILVSAGPGTGKTYTLIARIAYLIEHDNLNPGSEVLILSFSRAAVREIRRRTAAAGGDLAYVGAYTFDSFAARLLYDYDAEGDWVKSSGYEARIRYATAMLDSNETMKEYVQGFRHIFIDEVQDLVGERAEFVKAILNSSRAGFTLLGDPAQGIYTFQLKRNTRQIGAGAFYNWVRSTYKSTLQEYGLTENKRAFTDIARIALWAGAALNKPSPNYEAIMERLEESRNSLHSLIDIRTAALTGFLSGNPTTAILCRTNGQALAVSNSLFEENVPHTLRQSATERVVPAWIGKLFNTYQARSIGKSAFLSRFNNLFSDTNLEAPPSDDAWRLLKRVDGSSGPSLDLDRLASRIRQSNLPDELTEIPAAGLTVSTVHRAKGLEFDCVIVLDIAADSELEPEELAEEVRVLYVSLTRPKREMYRIKSPPMRGIFYHEQGDRWIRRYGPYRLTEFEFRGSDTHALDPAGVFKMSDTDPVRIQHYLQNDVRSGDPVTLHIIEKSPDEDTAYYIIMHDDMPVGITSESWSAGYRQVVKRNATWKIRWPTSIEGLHIESVDTVAGTPNIGAGYGISSAGIWLRARIFGLGRLRFEQSELQA